jgi:hypothetical protein
VMDQETLVKLILHVLCLAFNCIHCGEAKKLSGEVMMVLVLPCVSCSCLDFLSFLFFMVTLWLCCSERGVFCIFDISSSQYWFTGPELQV